MSIIYQGESESGKKKKESLPDVWKVPQFINVAFFRAAKHVQKQTQTGRLYYIPPLILIYSTLFIVRKIIISVFWRKACSLLRADFPCCRDNLLWWGGGCRDAQKRFAAFDSMAKRPSFSCHHLTGSSFLETAASPKYIRISFSALTYRKKKYASPHFLFSYKIAVTMLASLTVCWKCHCWS